MVIVNAETVDRTSQGVTPVDWTSLDSSGKEYTAYTDRYGTLICDITGDVAPSTVDIVGGTFTGETLTECNPSVYAMAHNDYVFMRLRVDGSPASGKGFSQNIWQVEIGLDFGGGNYQTAVIAGLDGNNETVYLTNPSGTTVYEYSISSFDFARAYSDVDGTYFVEFQLPIADLNTIDNRITVDTPLKMFFGTSTTATSINKDFMIGGAVSYEGLATVKPSTLDEYVIPTAEFDSGSLGYATSSTPTITGTTNAVDSPVITLEIDGHTYQATVVDGVWSVDVTNPLTNNTQYSNITLTIVENDNVGTSTQDLITDFNLPVITMNGTDVNLLIGDSYTDQGATALDPQDGDVSTDIITVSNVNTSVAGNYTVTYNVTDTAGNSAQEIIRTVNVTPGAVTTTGVDITGTFVENDQRIYVTNGETGLSVNLYNSQDELITTGTVDVSGEYVFTAVPFGSNYYVKQESNGVESLASNTSSVTKADNVAPIAINDSYETSEEVGITITKTDLISNDTDSNNDTLVFFGHTGVSDGVLLDNGDGTFTYTPNTDFHGSDSFTYTVSDGFGGEDTGSVVITITNTNDAPTVSAITDDTGTEDSAYSYNITSFFTDIDGDSLTYTATGLFGDLVITNGVITGTPVNADVGEHSITVTAKDPSNQEVSDTFIITITNTNDAPTVSSITDDEGTEDSAYSYDVTSFFTDVDGDSLTYTATGLFGDLSMTNGVITGTPVNLDVGEHSITVTAKDPSNLEVSDTFIITIINTNDAPTVSAITDDEGTEDSAYSYDVTSFFTDVDGDSLTYTVTGLFGDLVITNGVITGTPVNGDVGEHSVTITAKDPSNLEVSDTFIITITNTNDAPTVSAITDDTGTEDSAYSYNITSFFTDIDGDSLTYTATGLFGDLSITNGVITGTPVNADVGEHSVTITAKDPSNQEVSDTFIITISNTNDAPTVSSITDDTGTEDSAYSYDVTSFFTDADGDSLTYTATGLFGDLVITNGVITGTPVNGDVGEHSITVTAKDPSNLEVSDTFIITITNTNDAPTVSAITDDEGTEDSAYSYDVTSFFTDIDGDSLTYTATGLFGDLSITNGVITGTPVNGDVGEHSVTITAKDPSNQEVSDTFIITITNTNDAPTVSAITDDEGTEDSAYSFDVTSFFTDIDGDSLTYTATGLFGDLVITNGVITGTPVNGDVGEHSITVTAKDPSNQEVSDTFIITITNTNDAPTVSAITDDEGTEDSAYSYDVTSFFTDVDGDSLTYTATGLFGDLVITNGVITGTPVNADVGEHSITVTSKDPSNLEVSDTFIITITNTNDAPTVSSITDDEGTEDSAYSYDVTSFFTDIDGDSLTYTATGLFGDLSITNGVITGTPVNADVGEHSVTITAKDPSNQEVSDTFIITITNTNDAPTVSAITDDEGTEDSAYSYDVTSFFTDIDGDSLTYTATGLFGDLSITNGVITGTPVNADVGEHSITVTAKDPSNLEVSDTFIITITNTNDAPTVSDINGISSTEDLLFTYDFKSFFTDVDGDLLTYSITGLFGDFEFNGGVLTGTAVNSEVGIHTMTITAKDPSNAEVSKEFNLEVVNVNDVPTSISISDITLDLGSSILVDVSEVFTDVDSVLVLSLEEEVTGITFSSETGIVSGTASMSMDGIVVTINAFDGFVTISESFTITVINTTPPEENEEDVEEVLEKITVTEDIEVSIDLNEFFSDSYKYESYVVGSLPNGLYIDSSLNRVVGVPTGSDAGVHYVTISAFGNRIIMSKTIEVEVVEVNDSPISYGIPFISLTESEGLNLLVNDYFYDEDSELRYSFVSLPSGLAFNGSVLTGVLEPGEYSFEVTATDGFNTITEEVLIEVIKDNQAPVLVPVEDVEVFEGEEIIVDITEGFTDPEGDELEYTVTGLPKGLKLVDGKITGNTDEVEPGIYEVVITAYDGEMETKTVITLTIEEKPLTDEEVYLENLVKAENDADLMTMENSFVLAEGDYWEVITSDLLAITQVTFGNGSVVEWVSSDESVIGLIGREDDKHLLSVNRGSEDIKIVLTATVVYENAVAYKSFLLVVKAEGIVIGDEVRSPSLTDDVILTSTSNMSSNLKSQTTEINDSNGELVEVIRYVRIDVDSLSESLSEDKKVSLHFKTEEPDVHYMQAVEIPLESIVELINNDTELSIETNFATVDIPTKALETILNRLGEFNLYFEEIKSDERVDSISSGFDTDNSNVISSLELVSNQSDIEFDQPIKVTIPLNDEPSDLENIVVHVLHHDGTMESLIGTPVYNDNEFVGVEVYVTKLSEFLVVEPASNTYWMFMILPLVVLMYLFKRKLNLRKELGLIGSTDEELQTAIEMILNDDESCYCGSGKELKDCHSSKLKEFKLKRSNYINILKKHQNNK